MTDHAYSSFMDVMDALHKEQDKDPLRAMLVLTYEFDESQFLNMVSGRRLIDEAITDGFTLAAFRNIMPIVFFDAAKTREWLRLPPFCELHPWKPRYRGSHHSKAYCLITGKAVHLVIGSFNLTFIGLFQNREVFEYWRWGDEHRDEAHILRQWINFIRGQYLSRLAETEQSRLNDFCSLLEERMAAMSSDSEDSALLFSGYDGRTGIDEITSRWRKWFPGEEPDGLLAVSPFFDQRTDTCIAVKLRELFSGIKEITFISSEQNPEHPALCRKHFGGENSLVRSFLAVPPSVGDMERKEVEAEHNIAKDAILHRNLHAKALLLYKGNKGISYIGSANFSNNAWTGKNQELGFARKCADIAAVRREIMDGLWVGKKERFPELPEISSCATLEDSEDTDENSSAFPDFIEYILLRPGTGEREGWARFHFFPRANKENAWDNYRVSWGGEALSPCDDSCQSQWLDATVWQPRLAEGRALRFLRKHPEGEAWFPFRFDGDIMDGSVCHLPLSSMQCLAMFCVVQDGAPPPDTEPEGNSLNDQRSVAEIARYDRNANPVIEMQQYLNLFPTMEHYFKERLARLLRETPPSGGTVGAFAGALHTSILQPLNLLAATIMTEMSKNKTEFAACCFRLGELILFIRRLGTESGYPLTTLDELAGSLSRRLLEWGNGQGARDSVVSAYIDFVLTGRIPEDE